MPTSVPRPSVFVGSSSEGLCIAQAVQVLLDPVAEVELWTQGVFGLMRGTLESLVAALSRFDFAILVLTADDLLVSRGTEKQVARDNVLFELGLFVGGLGQDRTFMLFDRSHPPSLPSDLAGVVAATYVVHSTGNLEASLGAPCTRIQGVIEKLGMRENRSLQGLAKATQSVEGAGATMHTLLRLLVRSRKVELDVITAEFGFLIDGEKLEQLKHDLRDIEASLEGE